jgi:predicted Zn-dependent peptidase
MDSQYYSREQIFGNDQSLNAITSELLKRNHEYYFSKPISIFVAGTFDLDVIINELEILPLPIGNRELVVKIHEPKWNNKSWHEFKSTDIDTHTMHIGGIFNNYSVSSIWGIDFILELLTHEEFGTLQTWIRKDNGWSYGLEPDIEFEKDRVIWGIKIPLNSHTVAGEIRKEVHKKIKASLLNLELIKSTKERLLLETCFDYETVNSRLVRAVYVLNTAGYVPTQTNYKDWLENVNDELVTSLYEQFFAPEHIGEFLAIPKTE